MTQRAAVVPDDVSAVLSSELKLKEKLVYRRSAVVTMRITLALNDGR